MSVGSGEVVGDGVFPVSRQHVWRAEMMFMMKGRWKDFCEI